MQDSYFQSLRIFIASPSDVQTEREIAEEVINEIDIRVRDTLGIHPECRRWEHEPPFAASSEEGIQQKINQIIANCHIFILILYKRYGSVEDGETESNTEREVNLALKILKEKGKMMFLSYFHELPPNEDMGEQEQKVIELRNRLEREAVLYRVYDDKESFRNLLIHDLYDTILRFRLSTSKKKALRAFWQLGIVDGQRNPRLAIVYPPLNRRFMREETPDNVWLERLVPNVVFEDFKAMQKIDKTLRLIGFSEIETYNSANFPIDIQDRN